MSKKDARGAAKGEKGNKPHERCDKAATLIRELAGYGMPQEEISRVLNKTYGGGYSVDTLDRHYRDELDAAMAERKAALLRRMHHVALGEGITHTTDEDGNEKPTGVSADVAFRESIVSAKWLLGAVHRVRDGMEHDFGAGTINVTITGDDAKL